MKAIIPHVSLRCGVSRRLALSSESVATFTLGSAQHRPHSVKIRRLRDMQKRESFSRKHGSVSSMLMQNKGDRGSRLSLSMGESTEEHRQSAREVSDVLNHLSAYPYMSLGHPISFSDLAFSEGERVGRLLREYAENM